MKFLLAILISATVTIPWISTEYVYVAEAPHNTGQFSQYITSSGAEIRTVTAYTLRPEETDDTPCETALGKKVDVCEWSKRELLCATRAYPLLTRLRVGDLECIVADRTAQKYGERVDLLLPTVEEALQWGKQELAVVVIQ